MLRVALICSSKNDNENVQKLFIKNARNSRAAINPKEMTKLSLRLAEKSDLVFSLTCKNCCEPHSLMCIGWRGRLQVVMLVLNSAEA